jgi:hypothetical protein
MKVHIVKDKSGSPVASFEPRSSEESRLEPQVSADQEVEEVELPEDYATKLHVVYENK